MVAERDCASISEKRSLRLREGRRLTQSHPAQWLGWDLNLRSVRLSTALSKSHSWLRLAAVVQAKGGGMVGAGFIFLESLEGWESLGLALLKWVLQTTSCRIWWSKTVLDSIR